MTVLEEIDSKKLTTEAQRKTKMNSLLCVFVPPWLI